jgi:hypothetical protein
VCNPLHLLMVAAMVDLYPSENLNA